MTPIEVFLDTSVLPREPRPGHILEQLGELAKEGLAHVHLSDVAEREWRSQRVADFQKVIASLQSALSSVSRHPWSERLPQQKQIRRLTEAEDELAASAEKAANDAVTEILGKIQAQVIPVDGEDGRIVMDRYFDAGHPFSAAKKREDIPDAFIFRAAERLIATLKNRPLLCVCADQNLRNALQSLAGVQTIADLPSLVHSEAFVAAMQQLEITQLWRRSRSDILGFLAANTHQFQSKLDELALEKLPGGTVTDSEIPEDNGEALISGIGGVEDLAIDWDQVVDWGPAWIVVPFSFECDVELEFMVYCADAFHVPSWVHVAFGDFEEHRYFDASASRRIRATGSLSIRFTREELEEGAAVCPQNMEIEVIDDIELVDHSDGAYDDFPDYDPDNMDDDRPEPDW